MRQILLFLVIALALLVACGSPAPAPAIEDAAGAQVVTVYRAPT